jgi:hypothetical protein
MRHSLEKYRIESAYTNNAILSYAYERYADCDKEFCEHGDDIADFLDSAAIWLSSYSLFRILRVIQNGIKNGGDTKYHLYSTSVANVFDVEELKTLYKRLMGWADCFLNPSKEAPF